MAPSASLAKLEKAMRERALSYPQVEEAHPWGELAVKVKGKTFLFMRLSDAELSYSVKLPRTGVQALALPFVKPTEYGLGKHGWVTVRIAKTSKELSSQCLAWIDESYRAVAPKKVVDSLDAKKPPKPAETSKKRRA